MEGASAGGGSKGCSSTGPAWCSTRVGVLGNEFGVRWPGLLLTAGDELELNFVNSESLLFSLEMGFVPSSAMLSTE